MPPGASATATKKVRQVAVAFGATCMWRSTAKPFTALIICGFSPASVIWMDQGIDGHRENKSGPVSKLLHHERTGPNVHHLLPGAMQLGAASWGPGRTL